MLQFQSASISVSSFRPNRFRSVVVSAKAAKGFGSSKAPSNVKVPQTCACGSKIVYRECCEPFHSKKKAPDSLEEALRARFSAYSKGEIDYLIATDRRTVESEDQKKRDIVTACNKFSYTGLKILETEAGGSDIKFSYKSKRQPEKQAGGIKYNSVVMADKNMEDRNLDGSFKVFKTLEKSKFLKIDGNWVLTDSEVISVTEEL